MSHYLGYLELLLLILSYYNVTSMSLYVQSFMTPYFLQAVVCVSGYVYASGLWGVNGLQGSQVINT